jgi:hypothetical protein
LKDSGRALLVEPAGITGRVAEFVEMAKCERAFFCGELRNIDPDASMDSYLAKLIQYHTFFGRLKPSINPALEERYHQVDSRFRRVSFSDVASTRVNGIAKFPKSAAILTPDLVSQSGESIPGFKITPPQKFALIS